MGFVCVKALWSSHRKKSFQNMTGHLLTLQQHYLSGFYAARILDELCALRQKLLTIIEVPKFCRAENHYLLTFTFLLISTKKKEEKSCPFRFKVESLWFKFHWLRISRVAELYCCHTYFIHLSIALFIMALHLQKVTRIKQLYLSSQKPRVLSSQAFHHLLPNL